MGINTLKNNKITLYIKISTYFTHVTIIITIQLQTNQDYYADKYKYCTCNTVPSVSGNFAGK